jgi:hypothetical protein
MLFGGKIMQKISKKLKKIFKIKHWFFTAGVLRLNTQQIDKKPLDPIFRKELEEYFKEDKELLQEIILKHKSNA